MPRFGVPGVRTVVTFALVGATVFAGIQQLPSNPYLDLTAKMMEYSIVFFFGTKAGEAAERARTE